MKKLVGGLLVVACLAALAGCTTSKQGYVAKGNKLYAAGKYADAVINYNKAIQKDRNYGEAFYRLALADVKLENSRAAFNAFYRASQLLPNSINIREQLGSLSLEYYFLDPRRPQVYYTLVKQISDDLLKRNPKSFEGLREQAYLALTDGKVDESISLFRSALEVNPSDAVVTTALVQNLLRTGHSQEAEKIGLDLIARQKSYGNVYDVMYEWYMRENRPADAENIVKAKVNNNPKQGGYLLELAAHYDRVHKPGEMQTTLQRLIDDPKDFPQGPIMVGDLYMKLRKYPEALRYFEEGARTSKDDDKVLYQKRAANALLAEGKRQQAASTVDQILAENPKDPQTRLVQANILLKSGDPRKIEAAEHEFLDLAAQRPRDASIPFKLGQAEELRGNLDAARARYVEALNKNANYLQARYALAEISLNQKRPDEALQQANEILKVRPDDPKARLLRAQALARSGNEATARAELARIKDFEHNTQAQVELGLLALSEKKFTEAEQIFGRLRATGDPEAISGLARAYAYQKQFDKALAVLNDELKKSKSMLLMSQLGSIQALAGQYDASIATFRKLIALEPKLVRERLELADVMSLKGDDKGAVDIYSEAAKLAPADATAGLELAKALARAGRTEEARAQYQIVLSAHPDDAMALNDMAYFVAQNGGNLDQALGFAQRALQRAPGQPSFSDTMGCIYLKKGLNDSALQVFGNLVKKYPAYPTFHYHLGMALLERGDKKSAKKELEAALAAHPSRQDEARIKSLLGKIG